MFEPLKDQTGSVLHRLLGWLSSAIMFLLVLEGGLRILPISCAGPVVTINEPDPTLGWVKQPSRTTAKNTSEFDIEFSINALGLRDDADLTLDKPKGQRRVLVVGDSFVLGYTVDRADLFVDQVEHALRADGRDVQVLNGGTEGYSTDQELLWLRTRGLQFKPDVVVLCFYQNDVYLNGQTSYVGKIKPRFPPTGDGSAAEPMPEVATDKIGYMARKTAIGGMFHRIAENLQYGDTLVCNVGDRRLPVEVSVTLTRPPAQLNLEDCWARTATALRGFKATCDQQQLRLLLVTIPSREQVHPDARAAYRVKQGLDEASFDPDLPTRRMQELATAAGVEVLDPLPELKKEAANGKTLYFAKDWHVNPDGNVVLARILYQKLTTDRYLGGGSSEKGLAAIGSLKGPQQRFPTWLIVLGVVWALLSFLYIQSYRDEKPLFVPLKIGTLIASVVLIVWGFGQLVPLLGPTIGRYAGFVIVATLVGYFLYKSWPKLGIIREVYGSFVRNGHWYMLPLVIAMLTIGSLLVVASSSPFIAPFIYTLF